MEPQSTILMQTANNSKNNITTLGQLMFWDKVLNANQLFGDSPVW